MNTPPRGKSSPARTVFLLLSTVLAGCAGQPIQYVPYKVETAVPVPCAAELPEQPKWATNGMPRVDPKTGEGIDVAVDKLTAEREQRAGYEAKLRAAVKGCQ